MVIAINPGSGSVKDCGYEQAYKNIVAFIEDTNNEIELVKCNLIPDRDGRYNFVVRDVMTNDEFDIAIPSLPLEQVRYMKFEGQNIWDFPRLYVDGSSWIWNIAITFWEKEHRINQLKERIEEKEDEINELKEIIKQIENKF